MRWLVALAIGVAVVGGLLLLRGGDEEVEPPVPTTAPTTVPPMLGNALALSELDGWLQTDIVSLDDLRGRVVIVQFWTFGCYNCTNTIPHLQEIYAKYQDSGLEIVGVHAPEFDYEREPDAILAAAADLGVTWPIALDTERRNFRAWQGSPRLLAPHLRDRPERSAPFRPHRRRRL